MRYRVEIEFLENKKIQEHTKRLGLKQGLDLQNILRLSYNNAKVRPTVDLCDGRLICKTSYEERKAFLRYDSLAKS